MASFGLQVEFIDFTVVEEHLAKVPLHAFIDQCLTKIQAVRNL